MRRGEDAAPYLQVEEKFAQVWLELCVGETEGQTRFFAIGGCAMDDSGLGGFIKS